MAPLNLTLRALATSFLQQSPAYSIPALRSGRIFKFSNLAICRSFKPYVSSFFPVSSISLSSSTFSNFTDSVIYLTSDNHKRISYDTTLTFSESALLFIEECTFKHTRTDFSGSAIFVDNKASTISLVLTGFSLCHANNDGGACYLESQEVNLTSCCFLGCLANVRGQALDISGNDDRHTNIDQLSVDQCSPQRSQGEGVSVFIRQGNTKISAFNSTYNFLRDMGACVCIAYSSSLVLRFSTFISNEGANCFWLHAIRAHDELSSCNIIENKVFNQTGVFVFENSTVVLSGFIFIGNTAPVYFMAGELTLSQCAFDIRQKNALFASCSANVLDSIFNQGKLKAKELPELVTWGCWARGAPSPTPSQSLVPIESTAENAAMGITVLAILLAIGFASGTAAYFLMGNTGEREEVQGMESLSPN